MKEPVYYASAMLHPVGGAGAGWVSVCLTGMALVTGPAPVAAQGAPAIEVAGGYASMSSGALVDTFGSGWFGSAAWALNEWLALAGEAGGNSAHQTIDFLDIEADFTALLAGAKLTMSTRRLRPFAQVLAGTERIITRVATLFPFPSTGAFEETHTALQVGGGVDVRLGRGLAARLALDYRRVFAPQALDHVRFLAGGAYGFGRR